MKLLFVLSTPPHGSIRAQEALDALLMGSAFTDCSLLLVGQGVLSLLKNQETGELGLKNFALGFSALAEFGVTRVFCPEQALVRFDLARDDLSIAVEPLAADAVRQLFVDHDRVLNF